MGMTKKQWYKTHIKPFKKPYGDKYATVKPLHSIPYTPQKPQREINHTPMKLVNPPKVLTPKKLQKKIAYNLPRYASPVPSIDKVSQSTAETNVAPVYTQYRTPPRPITRKLYNQAMQPEDFHSKAVVTQKPQSFTEKKYNTPLKSSYMSTHPSYLSRSDYHLKKQKEQVFKNRKSSRFGFARVFGQSAGDFFAECEVDCPCIEAIFGKGDAEMSSETSNSLELTHTHSVSSPLFDLDCAQSQQVLRLDNEHEMVISIDGEEQVPASMRSRQDSGDLSLGSYQYSNDVEMEEPFNGYDMEMEKIKAEEDASTPREPTVNKLFGLW